MDDQNLGIFHLLSYVSCDLKCLGRLCWCKTMKMLQNKRYQHFIRLSGKKRNHFPKRMLATCRDVCPVTQPVMHSDLVFSPRPATIHITKPLTCPCQQSRLEVKNPQSTLSSPPSSTFITGSLPNLRRQQCNFELPVSVLL